MAYTIKKVDVWAGEIADRPGGLADKLSSLSDAGTNLEFLISRRAPDKPGTGVVFSLPSRERNKKALLRRVVSLQPTACIQFVSKAPTGPGWARK